MLVKMLSFACVNILAYLVQKSNPVDEKRDLRDKTFCVLVDKFVCELHNNLILMEQHNKKEELVPLIRIIDKEFKKDFERRLSEYGLTAQQGRLLFYINWNIINGKNVRQVDIEKHFQLTKSTVHGLINRMEKANLVIKNKDKNNQYIEISEDCKKILEDVFSKRMDCLNKMLNGVTDEEIETLHTLLMKIYENRDKGGDK